MKPNGFQFKQFYVAHHRCAMKVGTDGVLIGAWASVPAGGGRILDIGTGCGLIALMLAQRSGPEWQSDAIDLDSAAAEQARDNFAASPWSERLHAYPASLQDWTSDTARHGTYRLIVSNPPYFRNALKNPDDGRRTARHTDCLSFDDLLCCSAVLLQEGGLFALILPAEAEDDILRRAGAYGLYPVRLCRVHSRMNKPVKRILIELQRLSALPAHKTDTPAILCLEPSDAPESADYARLVKDFYL